MTQEKFCQAYVETSNASEAYRRAYDTENMKPATVKKRASEMLAKGVIAGTISDLQEVHRRGHWMTVDSLTDMYYDAFNLAKRTAQPSAMISAVTGLAKLHGLITDRVKHEGGIAVGFADRFNALKTEIDAGAP